MWQYNRTEDLPGNSLYHSADELYHYGILGMHWHHRKAQIKKYKELKKMKKQETNDKLQKEVNSRARAFGSDYVKLGANSRALIGAGQLAWAGSRFKTAKNHDFGRNGQVPMYLNAAFNTALAARGISNLISAKKTRKALNEYEYNRLKSAKNKKKS